MKYKIADATFDTQTGVLKTDGHEVKLQAKALALFNCLLNNDGAISHQQLIDEIWQAINT